MSRVKLSIIVPVYNVEKYLKKCLDSLINQTLAEIEIICVNDGSTDNSLNILQEYSQKDKRVKIINKENSGLGFARNVGIEHAQGDYIGFVDSDDWVSPEMYEKMYENAKKNDSDMVICQAYLFDDETHEIKDNEPIFNLDCFNENFNNRVFNHEETKDFLFNICVTAWNKIYKAQFLSDNKIKFFKISFEDNIFFTEAYLNAKRVSLVNEPLYYYRINRDGSIIKDGNKKFFDIIPMNELIESILIETNNYKTYENDFLIFKISSTISRFEQVDDVYKEEFFNLVKNDFQQKNLKPQDINNIHPSLLKKYDNIMSASYWQEYELLNEINRLKELHETQIQGYQEELHKQLKLNIKNKNKECSKKIKAQKKEYEKKIKVLKLINEEITSSNSWKITKPLREIKNIINKLNLH